MIYLLLSIFFNTSLLVIFKYFEKFKIENLPAIVVNYMVAACLGFINNKSEISNYEILHQHWMLIAVMLGLLFISVFNLIALTAQRVSVSAASVSSKMSVVIPVIAAFLFYHDSIYLMKITGIIFALLAVYLTSKQQKKNSNQTIHSWLLLLPATVFIGSGIIDALVNYAQVNYVSENDTDIFISSCFSVASLIGLTIVIYQCIVYKKIPRLKSIVGGIILGIPNYCSIFL